MLENIPYLGNNELPGKELTNKIIRCLRNIRSGSNQLDINQNPQGGLTFTVNPSGGDAQKIPMHFDVKAVIRNREGEITAVTIRSGSVYCPSYSYTLGETTRSVYAADDLWLEVTIYGVDLKSGSFPGYCDLNAKTINLPLLKISVDGKSYTICHQGDVFFPNTPMVHVPQYQTTGQLTRDIIDGQEIYVLYEECDDDEAEL